MGLQENVEEKDKKHIWKLFRTNPKIKVTPEFKPIKSYIKRMHSSLHNSNFNSSSHHNSNSTTYRAAEVSKIALLPVLDNGY